MQSRIVCFVCGSFGGDYPLHSRTRESGAYFPFLEHHEPPKGCRLPRSDGVVDSCRVCYAFLNQQWETYERSNTPAIKRLYWLKRIDDGQFTGAEMKLQGEYMAQVMGLQYQPACGDNCAPLSPDESNGYSRDGFGTSSTSRERKQQDFGDGVLDLSVPIKPEPAAVVRKSEKRSRSHHEEEKSGSKSSRSKPTVDEYGFVCYTCGSENQGVVAKFITSQQHAEYDQFYPFLAKLTPPKGALPLNSQGVCQVCDHCYSSLRHQWLSYEHHGTPNSARIFKVNGFFFSNDSSISMAASDDTQDPSVEVCYLCSQSYPQMKLCPLFTSLSSRGQESQMYFPFIRELRRPNGARPLNPDGSVRVCINCYQNLQSQWQQYEAEKVSILVRRYSLLPPISSSSEGHLIKPKSEPVSVAERDTKSPLQPLNIEISKAPESPVKGSLHAPPHFTATTNSVNSIPVSSLELAHQQSGNLSDGKATSGQPIPHPLLQAGERPKKVCFICGEKCLIVKMHILYSYPAKHETKTAGGTSQSVPFFPFLANREPALHAEPMTEDGTVTACSYCFYSLLNQWRDFEESKSVGDKNRWLRKYVTNEFVCFVCSLSVKRRKMRTLEVQKFQFLREHKAPSHGALVMWGGEAVGVCGSCHFSLTHQYAEYERLGVPPDLRKYNWTVQNPALTNENSCDGPENGQGHPSSGNEDSNLSIDDAIGVPPGGQGQTGKPPPPPFSLMSPGALVAAAAAASASANASAMGGGSSGASKLPLKTATVPPLSQQVVSPPNGHLAPSIGSNRVGGSQTPSSFAAALRKLAHQAKDPADEGPSSLKSSTQSPPAAHSPRATTPKRSPHPLAFPSSHSLPSTLPAPPVVTIAPTPAHHHHPHSHSHHHRSQSRMESRQTADRTSSTPGLPYDSSSSSSNNPNNSSSSSSGKNEREHHPRPSSHSREEELIGSKDSPLSRTPSRLYPQVSSAANGLSSLTSQALTDLYGMGYSPYRLEEEVAAHHGLSLPYGIDPAAYAAAVAAATYHPALLQQHPALLHSPFRLDDPLLLERYRMLQSPYFPFPVGATGLLPSQAAPAGAGNVGVHSLLASAAAAGRGYPPEVLQQQYQGLQGLGAALHPLMMDPRLAAQAALLERSRLEEDSKAREKERERELEQQQQQQQQDKRERERDSERGLRVAAASSSHHHHHQQHGADRREAGGGQAAERERERGGRGELLTIPTRAVHPLERGERSERSSHRGHNHHHHHQEDTGAGDRGGRHESATSSKHAAEAYQGTNLRSDRQPGGTSSKTSSYPSSHSHADHPHRKASHSAAVFKDRFTAAIPSAHHHQPPFPLLHSLPGGGIKLETQDPHHPHPHPHPHHHSSHGSSSSALYNSYGSAKRSSRGSSPEPAKVSPYASSSSSSSHNHVDRKPPKPTDLSRLFRPFDEPTVASSPPSSSPTTQKEDNLGKIPDHHHLHHHHRLSDSSLSSSSSPYHLPPSSRLSGLSGTAEGNSRFPPLSTTASSLSSSFSSSSLSSSLHESKTPSEVLSIPVLRVQPQSHSTLLSSRHPLFYPSSSSSATQPPAAAETKPFSSSPPPLLSSSSLSSLSSSSSSKQPISHCINDRIERFDFKSLAREFTSSASSSSPTVSGSEGADVHPMPPLATSSTAILASSSSSLSSSSAAAAAAAELLLVESRRPRESMSKLDLEEKRRREAAEKKESDAGKGGGNCGGDDEVDVEERMNARLTMIGRATPLPLDTAEDKLRMLEAVGLTTRMRKKELLLKKEARRRRQQGLASTSPVLTEVDQTQPFHTHTHTRAGLYDRYPRDLLRQHFLVASRGLTHTDGAGAEGKAEFLRSLALTPSESPSSSSSEQCLQSGQLAAGTDTDNCLKRKFGEATGLPASTFGMAEFLSATATTATMNTTISKPAGGSGFPQFPLFNYSSSSSSQADISGGKRRRRSPPPTSLKQNSHHPDREAATASQSPLQPPVMFSNVDSWLHGDAKRLLAQGYRHDHSGRLQPRATAGSQDKNRETTNSASSIPFPYLNATKLEGTNQNLPQQQPPPPPRLAINVPSLPSHWNLVHSNQNKTDMSALKSSASGAHNPADGKRDVGAADNPFSHPMAAVLLEDKHRADGEQNNSSSGSSYELTLPDLKRGFHNFR